jgi:hypothetical protein
MTFQILSDLGDLGGKQYSVVNRYFSS